MMRTKAEIKNSLDMQKATLEEMGKKFPLVRICIANLKVGDKKLSLRTGTFSTVIAIREKKITPNGTLARYVVKGTDNKERPLSGRDDLHVYILNEK